MERVRMRSDNVELPRVRDFDENGVRTRLERRIDVTAHAVADHPHLRRIFDSKISQHAPELVGRLPLDDPNPLERNRIQYAAVGDALELILSISGLRVQRSWQRPRQTREGIERAVEDGRRSGNCAAEQQRSLNNVVLNRLSAPGAQRLIRRAERVLHAARTEAVRLAHHGIDLVMMHAIDFRLRKAGLAHEAEKLTPRILEARRGIDERIVEIDEDELWGAAFGHVESYYNGCERANMRG